ncbi:MAG: DUF2063 domain-containing protein [Sphingomonadales bacterium]|nr:DUF2063 domain-containing protein [Sphingomonadales bacterium]NCO50448.1 DUF2063 domain-containing protein [Sphingomonadales bacterium]NCP00665.1 DUF2063 domain-containing protein [Sphingomonadales bacterium]NCP44480.1 DUF2063 domain-containing protein [Sphingomonadales bacterium]NCP49224.1 DUF2063 domain-containing protein [Sphingomonadales bacterium]
MLSLEQLQLSMMTVLDQGPAYLPADMFKGTEADWLRGMKVHANTVSHARLVALEDTFPKTRECLGHLLFNQISRQYVEIPAVSGFSLDQIGRIFADFLELQQIDEDVLDLARVEWAWLESYHAVEAIPFGLGELADLGEEAILGVEISLHPSVRTIRFETSPHQLLTGEIPGLADAPGLLVVRPFEQVLLSPINLSQIAAIAFARAPISICNLFAKLGEQGDDAILLPTLITLIEAGALIRISGEMT